MSTRRLKSATRRFNRRRLLRRGLFVETLEVRTALSALSVFAGLDDQGGGLRDAMAPPAEHPLVAPPSDNPRGAWPAPHDSGKSPPRPEEFARATEIGGVGQRPKSLAATAWPSRAPMPQPPPPQAHEALVAFQSLNAAPLAPRGELSLWSVPSGHLFASPDNSRLLDSERPGLLFRGPDAQVVVENMPTSTASNSPGGMLDIGGGWLQPPPTNSLASIPGATNETLDMRAAGRPGTADFQLPNRSNIGMPPKDPFAASLDEALVDQLFFSHGWRGDGEGGAVGLATETGIAPSSWMPSSSSLFEVPWSFGIGSLPRSDNEPGLPAQPTDAVLESLPVATEDAAHTLPGASDLCRALDKPCDEEFGSEGGFVDIMSTDALTRQTEMFAPFTDGLTTTTSRKPVRHHAQSPRASDAADARESGQGGRDASDADAAPSSQPAAGDVATEAVATLARGDSPAAEGGLIELAANAAAQPGLQPALSLGSGQIHMDVGLGLFQAFELATSPGPQELEIRSAERTANVGNRVSQTTATGPAAQTRAAHQASAQDQDTADKTAYRAAVAPAVLVAVSHAVTVQRRTKRKETSDRQPTRADGE